MRIKELEEKSGVPRTTIHFYLRHGLLHSPQKTGRTMAYYDETHLQRLKQIENLKKGSRVPLSFLKEKIGETQISPQSISRDYDVSKIAATTKEKAKKRQEIIKKAIEVFTRTGYHRTKIMDITHSLNISTGTFYIYFNNKRDLFIEVIDDVFRNIVGEAAAAIKGEDDYLKRMEIRGRVFYENYTKYSEILNQLRAEMAGDDQWPEEKIKKIYHGLTKPVIQEIETAIQKGIIKKVDPDLLAYALTGLIEIMSLRLSLDCKYTFQDVINFIADLITIRLVPE
ncbi:MAG: MerR family transcriptional regulator [Desulfobacteraceae bacterium]|nr:MerR family transcriptional regulator [Desulfobacteraceae bacterium]